MAISYISGDDQYRASQRILRPSNWAYHRSMPAGNIIPRCSAAALWNLRGEQNDASLALTPALSARDGRYYQGAWDYAALNCGVVATPCPEIRMVPSPFIGSLLDRRRSHLRRTLRQTLISAQVATWTRQRRNSRNCTGLRSWGWWSAVTTARHRCLEAHHHRRTGHAE